MPQQDATIAGAVERGLAPGGDLANALAGVADLAVVTWDDAQAVTRAVGALTPETALARDAQGVSALRHLVGLAHSVENLETYDLLRGGAVPRFLTLFDAILADRPADPSVRDDLLFLLATVSVYRDEASLDRVLAAARGGLDDDRGAWTAILSAYDPTHPFRVRLANALRTPLPGGALGQVYLAFANALAREGELTAHPFDTPEGAERLLATLEDPGARPADYLVAAQALGFLGDDRRAPLVGVAVGHADRRVRVEALRALAARGSREAVDALVELARDPRSFRPAASALKALGQGGRIPSASLGPEFQALAELAHWLAHPNEYDRPPDALSVIDTREVDWPPAGGRRRLWLIGYAYEGAAPSEGFGLVGSVTFSQLGEPIAGRSADDLYALHCCWELQIRQDPRAPGEATVGAGRALLGLS